MIEKKDLKVGSYYVGSCRNASYARWNGKVFIHWRTKWRATFLEEICHPDDEKHFDVFIPEYEIKDIPLNG